MYTSKDDYLINTLRFVSRREASQKYGAILPECLTSPEMKESKAYKTYLSLCTSAVPPQWLPKEGKKFIGEGRESVFAWGKYDGRRQQQRSTYQVMKASNNDNKDEEEVDQDNESKYDEMKSNEEQGMDDTTDQFDDDADARLEEPTETATEIVQGKGTNAEMTEAQQGNENLATTQEQVVDDAHVTITTVTKKTEVPVTSSSCSSNLASKFLNFSNIPHTDVEIVSPMDVPVHHEFPRTQAPTLLSIPFYATPTPPPTIETTNPLSNLPDFSSVFQFNDYISALEKEVAELKKDPLYTQVTSLVDEHLDTRLGETREEFMNLLSESFTARIKEQVKDQLPQILPKEVSNFAPHKDSTSGSSKGTQSEPRSSRKSVQLEEPVFEVADSDMPHDKEGNLGDNEDEPRKETASRSDWALSEKLDWENPEGGDYPFDLSKPLPLIMHGKRQRVPFEFFINNDLKYLQGGISTMTYTMSTIKTKATKYDLPGIKDMVPNIWSPVKVAYDKYALWGISHRDVRKTMKGERELEEELGLVRGKDRKVLGTRLDCWNDCDALPSNCTKFSDGTRCFV
ncbi:hypothetical protein Tco_1081314 [Tanacetum coccineum]|uniref:Uncharacterized protein n=1 Tax=Tanacetum coccineum TaxID=301880 RepID=A0ABQ5HXC5_9ASTR